MRFDYVKYDEKAKLQQEAFKAEFEKIEHMLETVADGRAKSLVLTYLEITYMWIGKAIRDQQIADGGSKANVPERTNE